ncbi:hypothetical protein WJX81_003213 [Elliptochloris bilobata]|uniref:Glutathione S-transferase n=1 Tax=Elliptochloris bilobata TaxID=381761 RepID=A0AAW1RIK1_9CHLO
MDFEVISYSPFLGEPWLRLKLGDWRGRITIPVLLLPSGALRDSFDIAAWGNEHRAKDVGDLFPEPHKQAICQWNEKSEVLLGYVRISAIVSAEQNPTALKNLLPPFLRGLGPVTTYLCKYLISTVKAKYKDMGGSREQALAVLGELSSALKAGSGQHLIGGALTYADITMAVPLKLMVPVGPPYNSLGGSPVGAAFDIPGLLDGFPDLVAWRNSIYRDFFPQAA